MRFRRMYLKSSTCHVRRMMSILGRLIFVARVLGSATAAASSPSQGGWALEAAAMPTTSTPASVRQAASSSGRWSMSAREILADIAAVHRCPHDDRSGWMRSRCIRIADALGASAGNSSRSSSKRGWGDRDPSRIPTVEYHGVLRAAAMVSDAFPVAERMHILTLLLNETVQHESLRTWWPDCPDYSEARASKHAAQVQELAHASAPGEQDRAILLKRIERLSEECVACLGRGTVAECVGSSACGLSTSQRLSTQSSDADLNIILPPHSQDQAEKGPASAKSLEALRKLASHISSVPGMVAWPILNARVPITKVHVGDATGYDADITVGNDLARNHVVLLARCKAADALFPALLSVVKHWCRKRGVDLLAGRKTSSFAFTLLVIAYLQEVGRLPRDIASRASETSSPGAAESASGPQDGGGGRHDTTEGHGAALATLLAGFFRFWALTDWSNRACSVGSGGVVRRGAIAGGKGWVTEDAMAVEDPEDGCYNVASHVTARALLVIRAEMCRAFSMMRDACCLSATMSSVQTSFVRRKPAC